MIWKLSAPIDWKWIACLIFCSLGLGCSDVPEGFEKMDDLVAKKLYAFGAGDLSVNQAAYVLLQFRMAESQVDTAQVHEIMLAGRDLASVFLNQMMAADLGLLEEGARVEYLAPKAAIHGFSGQQKVHLEVQIEKCFTNQKEAARFLATSASEGLRPEAECMDLYTALCPELEWVAYNDLWLGFKQRMAGDSVKVDREVVIAYNTFLLSGERLDSLTMMDFTFGKAGQLLPAMQWGLAKMREGDIARILTPSAWAFGHEGHPAGRIPPHTPIYWDVVVQEVK
jgi:FKBP-type peptidyl-prolyl cis-trans isomerase